MKREIELVESGGVATLRVNRPLARNALNWAAQEQFATAVAQVAVSPQVRVLIITGAGEKAFVAGGDLKELSEHPEVAAAERLNRVMRDALLQVTQLPIPVIAAVNGDAFGGGCEILTACDLRIASSRARFCFAQARNGLTTGWGGAARLVRLLGQSRALELLLTARVFDAHEALEMGLVQRVVADDGVWDTAVTGWAQELMQLPQSALAALKQLTYAAAEQSIAQANALETALFLQQWVHPDHGEAVAAFVQKRPAQFGLRENGGMGVMENGKGGEGHV
jgi:enoyl-CoA hydratase